MAAIAFSSSAFVLVLFTAAAVVAFPSGERKAFVVYRMPPRCVAPPRDNVCDIRYEVRNSGDKFGVIMRSLSSAVSSYETFVPPACMGLVTKLICRNALPQCEKRGLIDYGDQHALIDEIKKCLPGYLGGGKIFQKSRYPSGILRDPYASAYTFNCTHLAQDPGKECPKPKYEMPLNIARDYYEKIRKVKAELANATAPEECKDKVMDVMACSYAYCSSDRRALLFQKSRRDCEDIGACLEKYGKLDEEAKEFLQKTCPKFPSGNLY